jgi:hypothetical protein
MAAASNSPVICRITIVQGQDCGDLTRENVGAMTGLANQGVVESAEASVECVTSWAFSSSDRAGIPTHHHGTFKTSSSTGFRSRNCCYCLISLARLRICCLIAHTPTAAASLVTS